MADGITDFLIIGAGLAGLCFARDAQDAGATVRVLDKARGIGGRCATRRVGETVMDHGAQYFTARSPRLQAFVAEHEPDNTIRAWANGFPLWENGTMTTRPPGHPRYAPPEGMNTLAKLLGDGVTVERSAQVTMLTRESDGSYQAATADSRTFRGRALILNLPPAQLLPLAGHLMADQTLDAINTVEYLPAWSLGLRLDSDLDGADFPAVEFKEHPTLGWVSRDHTKREPGAPPVLMIHAAGFWSRDHLEDDPGTVPPVLLQSVRDVFGPFTYSETLLHRWRYSLPTRVLDTPYLWDPARRIGACGDWCDGPRVEGAILSGWKLAEAVQ